MKILEANAGALTNFEVLDFLRSRGASKDPTRVILPIAQTEYKVYDYLVESVACNQSREIIDVFMQECKEYKLSKPEILNIINMRAALVDLHTIIGAEKLIVLEDKLDDLAAMIEQVFPPPPTPSIEEDTTTNKEEENNVAETETTEKTQDCEEAVDIEVDPDETTDPDPMEAS